VTEPSDPRVTVTLPGGRTVEARLHARRQDGDGHWWYEVTLPMPADTVRPIDGEDYSSVPTERADSPAWVLQTLPADTPTKRALILHKVGCWAAQGRLTPADDTQAHIFLREGWATACDACHPDPQRK
jgi:hypothetical protein